MYQRLKGFATSKVTWLFDLVRTGPSLSTLISLSTVGETISEFLHIVVVTVVPTSSVKSLLSCDLVRFPVNFFFQVFTEIYHSSSIEETSSSLSNSSCNPYSVSYHDWWCWSLGFSINDRVRKQSSNLIGSLSCRLKSWNWTVVPSEVTT